MMVDYGLTDGLPKAPWYRTWVIDEFATGLQATVMSHRRGRGTITVTCGASGEVPRGFRG